MSEGILERSDLTKIIADADLAGYNRGYSVGYSIGKQNASGIAGVTAVPQGVQSYTSDNVTMSTSKGSYGWSNFAFGTFPLPSSYTGGKMAAILHVFNANFYVVSTTGKYYSYGYWYDDDRGNPIEIGSIQCTAAGQSFSLKSIMTTMATGRYYLGLRFHGGNGEATTVGRVSYQYQWYLLEAP